jgi:predicted porin
MAEGVGKTAGWATILGTVGFVLSGSVSAKAADLGGDCCADLEERVAELEATTARKGNRKVSLTVSGWVNEAIFGWDDGTAHGVFQGTNSLEQSRVRFTGEAKINKDWSAGFVLEVGLQGMPSSQFAQNHDVSTNALSFNQDNGLLVRKDNWFIKSKTFGQVAVGFNGTATYHLLDDADAANTRLFADAQAPAVYANNFLIRNSQGNLVGGLAWSSLMRGFDNSTPGQGGRRSVVRYDSPDIAGFVVTTAWGQSDQWDAALTYKGSWNGISVLARAGYGQSNDIGVTPVAGTTNGQVGTPCGGVQPGINAAGVFTPFVNDYDCKWGGAAATIKHDPTGLYVYGGWGKQILGNFRSTPQPTGVTAQQIVPDQDSSIWFLQPGIEEKWFPIGKTTIFGQYTQQFAGSNVSGANPGTVNSTLEADIKFWQGGVVQHIDAAAMDLYAIYQHTDGSVTGCSPASQCPSGVGVTTGKAPNGITSLDAFQEVIVGGLIQF